MRKTGAALIMALLITAAAGASLVNIAAGNPFPFTIGGTMPPDSSTQPPKITIAANIDRKDISISFKVNTGASPTAYTKYISEVFYITDWNQNNTYVYQYYDPETKRYDVYREEVSNTLSIIAAPEGNHTITFFAIESGAYVISDVGYWFSIAGSSAVNFTVDTLPPQVWVDLAQNVTYRLPDLPLNFTFSEPVTQISYVLDGGENVTVAGNSTLTGLPVGLHNVTVYAWDAAGNVGASETATFTVAEPESFPTVPVAAVSAASIAAVIAAGLLLYNRKRRKEAQQT